MVTHSSRKDHECKLCGASFRTKGSLIRHHRRHTGELAQYVGHPCLLMGGYGSRLAFFTHS